MSQAPPTQAVNLESSQSLHPSLYSSRTNSNQYHAPAQLYPTASLQRGVSSLQSTLFSRLQAAPAGEPTAVFLPANNVHIVNNSQPSLEHQNPNLSTGQPPGQEPLSDPVTTQPSHLTKSQPATLLQSNPAIQLQASRQSHIMHQPNHVRKVEVRRRIYSECLFTKQPHKVSLIDHNHPSSNHPPVVERTPGPNNSMAYPGDSILTADVRVGLTTTTTQEPTSSHLPAEIEAVSLPTVHYRETTSRPTDLIGGSTTFELPHRPKIDVVPNNIIISSANFDEPKPVGDIPPAAVGTPVRSATYTPADKQDATGAPALLQPMETPLKGSSVPPNPLEHRVQPFIDGGRRLQVC